jgi:2-C-methyl-D-erythritol 4-phosphate cytidylyltransferase
MQYSVIITAGGTSSRYGKSNKLLEKINGKEVIKYSSEVFINHPKIDNIVICANISIIKSLEEIFKNVSKVKIIQGGKTRQESVYKGLCNIKNKYVLVHDGARPVISSQLIDNIIEQLKIHSAITVATKTTDTIKVVENNKVIKTLDRSKLYNIQTPQAFEYNLIKNAHEKFKGENFSDDAGLIEAYGENVFILENDYKNLKITTKNDLDIAKIYLQS